MTTPLKTGKNHEEDEYRSSTGEILSAALVRRCLFSYMRLAVLPQGIRLVVVECGRSRALCARASDRERVFNDENREDRTIEDITNGRDKSLHSPRRQSSGDRSEDTTYQQATPTKAPDALR